MAPNLQQRSILLQTAASQPIKAAFLPLTTVEVAQQLEPEYKIPASVPDSNDYWGWSGDNDVEIQRLVAEEDAARLVSAEHIVHTVMRQPVASQSTTTIATNDQYWDWSHAETESVDYWNWPVANDGQQANVQPTSVEETEAYWAW